MLADPAVIALSLPAEVSLVNFDFAKRFTKSNGLSR